MTTTDTQAQQLVVNRLTKTQFQDVTPSNTELYAVDPQFNGGKILATDSNGEIVESTLATTDVGTVKSVNNTNPDSNGNVSITVGDTLPSQTGNSGKFLTTDGSATSWETVSSGSSTDVQINGTSITSSNVANILTNTAYNSSSNKIATMSDVPSISGLANTDLSNLSSTGEAKFVKGTRQQIYPVVATYRSGSSWYRIYSDGWCEQGGHGTATSAATEYQVQLSKTMYDTNYTLTITSDLSSTTSGDYYVAYTTKAVGNFKVKVRPVSFDWKVEGLLATNQYTAYTIYGVK